MLTRLHFKNWRSLKDTTIDFKTPITVFIGANSSGKTNILDGLHFLQYAVNHSFFETVMNGRRFDVRTLNTSLDAPLEIDFAFITQEKEPQLNYTYTQYYEGSSRWEEKLIDSSGKWWLIADKEKIQAKDISEGIAQIQTRDSLGLSAFGRLSTFPQIQQTFQFITQRLQMLDENFMPLVSFSTKSSAEVYTIDRCAENTSIMLNFLAKNHSDLYQQLQDDLYWLLGHIKRLETEETEEKTRFYIQEKTFPDREAPTISAGTLRIIAMLLPFYALDMRYPELPGLVVIEEPDTALNPWLLQNFVEQLRNYTEREGHPRQVILTTHNPLFLNYFKPEEVHVVERDEQGYTHVNPIPEYVHDIWLKEGKYGLGEVWTTNSFGGLPK